MYCMSPEALSDCGQHSPMIPSTDNLNVVKPINLLIVLTYFYSAIQISAKCAKYDMKIV